MKKAQIISGGFAMGNEKPKIYLDSCFFVAIFNNEADKVDICLKVLKEVQNGRVDAVISTLVVAESAERSVGKLEAVDLFRQAFLKKRVVDFFIADQARNLIRGTTGIKGADAVHLVTAMDGGCEYFFTFDDKVIKKGKESLLAGLKISPPVLFWEIQPTLPGLE